MQVQLIFNLSPAGQKASLIAGGDGNQRQRWTIAKDSPWFAWCVTHGIVSPTGDVLVDASNWPGWDHVPTMDDVARDWEEREAQRQATKEAEIRARREATIAVLTERRTKTDSVSCSAMDPEGRTQGMGSADYQVPAWPHDADKEIQESPAAKEWLAELEQAKEVARERAFKVAQENVVKELENRRKIAAKNLEIEERRKALRAERGCEEGDESFNLEDGALNRVPIYDSHKRGRNWLALISANPSSPGGLERDFAQKARGECFYIAPAWRVGDAIEFGADYYTGGGTKNAARWYGFVKKITPDYVIFHKEPTGKSAIKAGAKYLEEHPEAAAPTAPTVADEIEAGLARVNGEGRIVPNEPSTN